MIISWDGFEVPSWMDTRRTLEFPCTSSDEVNPGPTDGFLQLQNGDASGRPCSQVDVLHHLEDRELSDVGYG